MNTAEGIVEALVDLDIEYIYGYPGGRVIEVFEALADRQSDDVDGPGSDTPVEVIRPRDERQASVMAEVHGRVTREPAVLAGQGPWIGSLGAIGQMEARLGSSPMLVLTEASERGEFSTLGPYQQARGDYGGVSLPDILTGVTKEHWFPRTPAETLRSIGLAYKHSVAGRPGPTAVILDGGIVTDTLPEDPIPPLWNAAEQAKTWEARPTAIDVEDATVALAEANRPVIIAGNGVHASGAYDELETVAETYDCPVVTSYLGKSTLGETHRRAAGVIGAFGHEGANRLVSHADVLLIVGCRLNPMDTNWGSPSFIRPEDQTIIHADIDTRNAGWVYPADIGLIGDAAESLAELAEGGSGDNEWALERAASAREDFTSPSCDSDTVPIKPQRAVAAIEKVVDADTIVTADSGNNRFWLLNYLQTPARRTYFGSGGVGGMGWAPPAAVSLAIATDRNVIAVAGDGGFAMTMTAVETAVEYDVAPTFVVLNDRGLGMVRQMDDHIPGVDFHDTDFVSVAEAFGANGRRIEDPDELLPSLQEAKTDGIPTVLDVRIDPTEEMADQLQSSFYADIGGLHE